MSPRAAPGAILAALAVVLAFLLVLPGPVRAAEPAYPALTGRVVDGAGVLPQDARQELDGKLKGLEDKSGIQLVVATVPSLDGEEIEPYANGLFRAWKLGEAKKNNGALLLIAPRQKRVRIEVGYGLEGTLTDALSKIIITNAIVPRFKAGDFAGGVERGVDDIIAVLSTDTSDWQKKPDFRAQDEGTQLDGTALVLLFVVVFVTLVLLNRFMGRRGGGGGGRVIVLPTGTGGWGGSFPTGGGGWSGGGSDGGFSGGGGSSGGGGASGGW